MNRTRSSSSAQSRPRRSNKGPAPVRDRLLTALSWPLLKGVGLPAAFLLALLPVLYFLLVPGGFQKAADTIGTARREPQPVPPEEDPFYGNFESMTAELEAASRKYKGQVGIYLKDLDRGWEWSYHADDLFPSASLVKLPVLIGVFDKIRRGRLSLSTQLKLRRRTRMGGSGSIKWQRDGTRFTVRRLLDKMIHESDNTAMRILIDEVGMGYIQRLLPKLGLVYTELYPEGLSLRSGRVRYENYTTAREIGLIFERLYRGKVVDRFASELMMEILKGRRRKRTRLAKGLPVGWEIAHKTGLLRRACHDGGVIFTPHGDYVLVVLTGRNRSYRRAKRFITAAGGITYRHYKSQSGLYAKAPSQAAP